MKVVILITIVHSKIISIVDLKLAPHPFIPKETEIGMSKDF
jgi:hypothetical protein